jgi:hypothetical protein
MPVKSLSGGERSAGVQNLAIVVMLGLVAWLTFAQTRALQEAHQLVREAQAAADRADRICRQSAMITISVRDLRDQILLNMAERKLRAGELREPELQGDPVAMSENAFSCD